MSDVKTGDNKMDILNSAKDALSSVQKVMNDAKASVLKTAEVGDLNAIELLIAQHREVDVLFAEFEQAGDKAFRTKETIYAKIAEKLRLHTDLEEKYFYPAAERVDKDLIGEAQEEHDVVKEMLNKLDKLAAEDSTFDSKVTVLQELVHHHVREEESDLFPKCKSKMAKETLDKIGEEMHREAMRTDSDMKGAKAERQASQAH